MDVIKVAAGDRATLRRPHPCGSYEWTVTRTGADIGLQCVRCGRRVMLPREEFERRAKRVASVSAPAPPEGAC